LQQIEGRAAVIVVATEQHRTLRDAAMWSDGHRDEVVNPHPFSDPGVVPDLKLPRILDGEPRFEHDTSAYACAETAEECPLEARWIRQWSGKKSA